MKQPLKLNSFFLVTIVVLWIDNIFLYLHKLGIIELVSTKALQKVNLPLSLLFIFLTFSFASSIALPVLSYLINQIYLEFLWQKVAKFFGFNFRTSEMPSDYVSAHKLRESAYMTKDKFLLDIYTSYEKATSEREIFVDKLASRALCCLILLSINYFIYGQKKSISFFLLNYLGSSELIWFCVMGLLLLIFFRFHTDDRDCVYCPSLYREMEKERQCITQSEHTLLKSKRF